MPQGILQHTEAYIHTYERISQHTSAYIHTYERISQHIEAYIHTYERISQHTEAYIHIYEGISRHTEAHTVPLYASICLYMPLYASICLYMPRSCACAWPLSRQHQYRLVEPTNTCLSLILNPQARPDQEATHNTPGCDTKYTMRLRRMQHWAHASLGAFSIGRTAA